MATLKLKHLILYLITYFLLYFSNMPGGALLSIAAWMQVCILLWGLDYNLKNQVNIFLYFITLMPLLFFLGSCSDFTKIYAREGSIILLFVVSIMTALISTLTALFTVLSFSQNISNFNVSQIYTVVIKNFLKNKKELFMMSSFLFAFILFPLPMRQDFKITLSIILIHLFLKRKLVLNLFSVN